MKQHTKKIKSKSRAQAAIFDGIMFLLLTSFSIAVIFSFLNTYGEAQDRVLRSANTINYMHSIMKEIYFINANTLSSVDNYDQARFPGDYFAEQTTYGNIDCKNLSSWSVSVADVVKKDLLDGKLDDKFGDKGGVAPGKVALRCLFKEIMKPFRQAGYHYFTEILNEQYQPIQLQGLPYGDGGTASINYPLPWITDLPTTDLKNPVVYSCSDSSANSTSLLAISTPFRILKDDSSRSKTDYLIRVCVWR